MSPRSRAWRICTGKLRPGAREESFRLITEKMVSILALCPYSYCGKARYI